LSESPDVSIVLPVHDDEEWVSAALQSCIAQTWRNFEVVCVDDASTDATYDIVKSFQRIDPRVHLHRHSVKRTAFQARRTGLDHARAPYVLFLDGDDQLHPDAVRQSLLLARTKAADLVGFGVEVVAADGHVPGRLSADLQPRHTDLSGEEILTALFPPGKPAQGHLWRYLWSVDLLRAAYSLVEADLELPRANDIPIAFLGVAMARRYVSTTEELYRYFWRRGVSGHGTDDAHMFGFYLGAMNSVEAVRAGVTTLASEAPDPVRLQRTFELARLSTIQMLLRRCEQIVDPDLQDECLRLLIDRVGEVDVIRAASTFLESALPLLARNYKDAPHSRRPVSTVMITTGNLQTGGVQGVVLAQAKLLLNAGLKVVIAVRSLDGLAYEVPLGADVVELAGPTRAEKIDDYLRICREHQVDVIIDHHILYNDDWPFFALAARVADIPTVGWLHSFALRTLFDSNTRGSLLAASLPILQNVVVLSKTDVAFWKLRGVDRVVCLPNPPSPWLMGTATADTVRQPVSGRLEIVWWGRLHQQTKRVRDLLEVSDALRSLGVDFHLTIIGPDSADTTVEQMRALTEQRALDEFITFTGQLHGAELSAALDRAHICVSTSAIEGYPLTLIEAQSMGMPVVMYDLPWLAMASGNDGLTIVPQGDARELARRVAELSVDPELYRRRSLGSLEAARAALTPDYVSLYSDLVNGRLSSTLSPAPTVEDAELLLNLAFDYSEESIRKSNRIEGRHNARIRELQRELTIMKRRVVNLRAKNRQLTSAPSATKKSGAWLKMTIRVKQRAERLLRRLARRNR